MKKLLTLASVALIMMSCGNSKPAEQTQEQEIQEQAVLADGAEIEKDGVYEIYRTPLVIQSENGHFIVGIDVTPDHSLPTVDNANFNRTYADNRARLTVIAGSDTIFSRLYTKSSFAEYIDSAVADRAVLNRITYRGATDNAVKFEAEISVPHSDEECYVTITVTRAGSVSMERYNTEAVPDELM